MVCDICMMVISTVDELLKNVDNKLDDVEDELNAICYALGDLADQVGKSIAYGLSNSKFSSFLIK